MQAKPAQASAPASQDMQSLGEGLGSALRTFREAASDVRNSIDPEMRTIQAELQAAEKEVEDTIESAKQSALPKDPPAVT
jgi:Sec-independent protein translocase protein TatA